MSNKLKLKNINVVFFESRLAKTMADLIKLQGGNPLSAPSMKEVPLENNPAAFLFAEKLFNKEVDLLILLTGVGTKALMAVLETRYSREKILEVLKQTTIVPRGPKPIRVLNELAVPFAVAVPEPNTWHEILKTLDASQKEIPLKGSRIFVQEYGVRNTELLEELEKRGAQVTPVPVYRWELPDDLEPLKKAVHEMIDGKMEVAVFTTAVQVTHLLKVARFLGLERKLKEALRQMVVASVGPDCTETLVSNGLSADIQPESPKMGPLVLEIAEKARQILESKLSSPNVFIGDQNRMIPAKSLPAGRQGVAGMTEGVKEDLALLEQSVFMKACRLEKTPYTPVWLMRQAGRYMKEYRRIRDDRSFLAICKDKDWVTEITVVAQEKIKADAAIIFSDILLLVECFGLGLEYLKGDACLPDRQGPSIKHAIRSVKDVENLPEINCGESLSFVFEAIRQTREALDSTVPLIGFAGAPFTLASYMIEGGASKDFKKTKHFMTTDEGLWKILMDKISRATIQYLNHQIEAGVQAVQLFDSWVGCLSETEYQKYVLPYSSLVMESLRKGTPVIHFGTGTAGFLKYFSDAGGDVISVDHRIELENAWRIIGPKKAIQGNLDPQVLCSDIANIKKHAKTILDSVKGRPGHIFNLGHGVLPETPVENVIALVDMVHEMSAR